MLNQISKLKGNEIFSLVTPIGEDKVITSHDLIGNVLNVVESKQERVELPPPPPINIEEIKCLIKEIKIRAEMAFMNSKEAIKSSNEAVDRANEISVNSNKALCQALEAYQMAKWAKSVTTNFCDLDTRINTVAQNLLDFQSNHPNYQYVTDALASLEESLGTRISTLNLKVAEHTNQITTINQDIQDLENEIHNLPTGDVTREEFTEVTEGLSNAIEENKQETDQAIDSLERQLADANTNLKVTLTKNSDDTVYTVKQGTRTVGTIDVQDLVWQSCHVETINNDPYLVFVLVNGQEVKVNLNQLVDTYTAGTGIDITNHVVSATPYTAGTGINVNNFEISAKIDNELNILSSNPVENKVIAAKINQLNTLIETLQEQVNELSRISAHALTDLDSRLNEQDIVVSSALNDLNSRVTTLENAV